MPGRTGTNLLSFHSDMTSAGTRSAKGQEIGLITDFACCLKIKMMCLQITTCSLHNIEHSIYGRAVPAMAPHSVPSFQVPSDALAHWNLTLQVGSWGEAVRIL